MAQRQSRETRGQRLQQWQARAESAYLASPSPDHASLLKILTERRMDWYAQGVVPAIGAFLSDGPTFVPLNLPSAGALPGAPSDAIVELPCRVTRGSAAPVPVPPLPDAPWKLTCRLIAYEEAVLSLADDPHEDDIAGTLMFHPFVTSAELARNLGSAIKKLGRTPSRIDWRVPGPAT
jgi:6-phospho-beta-glucosidase